MRLSFRLKIFLSLLGLVGLMLAVLGLALRRETARQIDWSVDQVTLRARAAFADLQRLWEQNLAALSARFTGSNRMPALLEESIDAGDPAYFAESARYEMELAGFHRSLAVFAGPDGAPFVALLDGTTVPWAAPLPEPSALLAAGGARFGYTSHDGRLFGSLISPLVLFGRPVGTMLIGFPVDGEVAERLGEIIRANLFFMAGGEPVMASPGLQIGPLRRHLEALAEAPGTLVLPDEGLALQCEPLIAGRPEEGARILAIPLGEILAPYRRIETTLWAAGALTLGGALLASYFLSHGLSAPVARLVAATRRVADGDYDFHVHSRSTDELGALARAFNAMIDDLALKRRYRSLLDKVVSREVAEEMLRGEIVLGGENRTVTTLFADLRGFTRLTQGMEPQEVIAMLNEFMDAAAGAVEAEGGVVDKYVGDAIMALFGAPVSAPDDALRAARAALGLQAAVERLNADRRRRDLPLLAAGVGLNTGLVVAGNMGSQNRLNYTVLGTPVNVAARLCARAPGGEVLISEATWREVREAVVAEPLEPLPLKGISHPVMTYRVTGLREREEHV